MFLKFLNLKNILWVSVILKILGISRTAIHKQINTLNKYGIK
ncbi:MAG: HTH domain-containing protein [Endomicrobium sp.]|nr:HTH domain-containing protein [Endomicrobium sp.]